MKWRVAYLRPKVYFLSDFNASSLRSWSLTIKVQPDGTRNIAELM